MKTVSLREITPDNWEAILKLAVQDDQKNFMAGNLYSLTAARGLCPTRDLVRRGRLPVEPAADVEALPE
ncbi:MAG: hypothetical protein GYA20_08700 [Chloroflexi bacterium]|nr:hypothetical protein [Chloroflexota bacterium]